MGKIKILKRVIGFLIVLLLSLVGCYACGDSEITSTFTSSVEEPEPESEPEPQGQVSVSLDTETNMVTMRVEITSSLTDGTEIKLHSSYLNHLYGSDNCGDVIATATVSDGWIEFSFENPAVTYNVEDGFRDRFWGTIWSTSSETCDSPDEWINFTSNLAVNPYYFEDCDSNGGIEAVFYADKIEVVPTDAACGEVYEEP